MKLRLKGAKGIVAGPELTWNGLEEIEIDFTGKQGLISFAGENGAGKSTVLECLHHYPQLVSRDGALWQHALGRSAEKEFICTFMGREYRSVIKMDADQGKQEGYLWIDKHPVVNGKITAYKEKVNEIFGQPFTYFRSQFCPQKSKKTRDMQIENMTAGVFRELLREFLNLQRYAGYEDTAKQAGNFLTGKAEGVSTRIADLQELVSQKADIETRYLSAGERAEFLRDDKTALLEEIAGKRIQIDALKETIQKNALALERKKDLQGQIDRIQADMAKEKETAASEIAALQEKWKTIKGEIGTADAVLQEREKILAAAARAGEMETEIAGIVAKVEEMGGDYPVYQKKCHDILTQIAALRQQLKDMENDQDLRAMDQKIKDAEAGIQAKEKEVKDLGKDQDKLRLEMEVKSLEQAAMVGEGIKPDCKETTCGAIRSVLEATEKLPVVRERLEERKRKIKAEMEVIDADVVAKTKAFFLLIEQRASRAEAIDMEKKSLAEQIGATDHTLKNAQQVMMSTGELLTMHRQELVKKRADVEKQKALAGKLSEIRVAESKKADLEKQLQEVTILGKEKGKAWAETEAAKSESIRGIRETMEAIIIDDTVKVKLDALYVEVGEIETVKIPDVEKEIQEAREKIALLQADLKRIEEAETELEGIRAKRDLLTRNASSWRYLQFACGKTGLQNLRIDGAAPRIVYNANRLLAQAYGARYSIRLETQNEAGKEDLNVKIIMENGQEVYLDDISGGQRTWNVQALWLAMSLLNQEKSGRKYNYFCADENDGALDPVNAENFTALYRPFMQEAGLAQLFYISHKPECRAMADHVLTFQHGKNPVWG